MPTNQSWGIDHTGIGVSDIAASAAFYDAVFATLGFDRVVEINGEKGLEAVGYGKNKYPVYYIDVYHSHSQRQHTAFVAESADQLHDFHSAALKAGGVDNGAPGPREGYPEGWWVAFALDPDGNNIEAIWHGSDRTG